jgi:hypothetical protein
VKVDRPNGCPSLVVTSPLKEKNEGEKGEGRRSRRRRRRDEEKEEEEAVAEVGSTQTSVTQHKSIAN